MLTGTDVETDVGGTGARGASAAAPGRTGRAIGNMDKHATTISPSGHPDTRPRIVATVFLVALCALLVQPLLPPGPLAPWLVAVALAGTAAAAVGLLTRRPAAGASSAAGSPTTSGERRATAEPDAIDPHTGTLTRRSITARLLESMAVAERYGRRLSVALVCVIPRVDDEEVARSHTHRTGIADVAAALGEALRTPDRIGRYAADRFLVVMPETELGDAHRTAARLRDTVVGLGQGFEVRIGVTQHRRNEDLKHLLTRAEAAAGAAAHAGGVAALSAA
jgi:diguanylate cyclase (GGDEF)-like protein